MKFFVGDAEKEFYKQNGLFGVEGVFSPEEIDELRMAAEKKVLLGAHKDLAMTKGRIQEILFSKKLGQIAFELVNGSTLRYGYDLFFRCSSAPKNLSSSVIPLQIGVCIPLESGEGAQESSVIPFTLRLEDLNLSKGGVLFFSPNTAFSFSAPQSGKDPSFLLLAYVSARAQYIFQPDDPFTHDLKRFGYVFGDRVKAETHPILYS